ncbi:hypothetical protein BCR33DRAFT_717925 [Rhizoclosmatium globosum]|uniref:Uncharacterized protein n=1 Tax=Rhizoclosmatium globosum TaxID=329046 RepID=A0A1Y2C6S5_9FUNG|nr:hypothetical protein BCR33DRAFT_717925 [Rhizoclosmatium globosum]|eukprot:ORY42732.1 hypothetical protein BCR33DRAFT_717925 [Rhizoclosmatium globosum]
MNDPRKTLSNTTTSMCEPTESYPSLTRCSSPTESPTQTPTSSPPRFNSDIPGPGPAVSLSSVSNNLHLLNLSSKQQTNLTQRIPHHKSQISPSHKSTKFTPPLPHLPTTPPKFIMYTPTGTPHAFNPPPLPDVRPHSPIPPKHAFLVECFLCAVLVFALWEYVCAMEGGSIRVGSNSGGGGSSNSGGSGCIASGIGAVWIGVCLGVYVDEWGRQRGVW